MDLSNPFAAITPTLDAAVLQVLAATTGWCTAAEVHRRCERGSDEGVRKVLARLVRQGVVSVETTARYPVYRLNREHVAARQIVELSVLRDELFQRIRAEVAGWRVEPVHAGLFGSFARGTADSDSDIDILLVRPSTLTPSDEDTWLDQIDDLERRLRVWTGNDAQVVDLAPGALEQMVRDADPLVDSWRADDVHVHGERILDVLRSVR
ncbi:MAG: nucleotidyltransferase family protein [Phycicoccus sp.]